MNRGETEVLSGILSCLASARSPDKALPALLDAAQRLTGFARIVICVVDRERRVEEARYSIGSEDEEFRKQVWQIDPSTSPWLKEVIEANRSVVIDPAGYPGYAEAPVSKLYRAPWVKVPIVVSGTVVGTLTADGGDARLPITDAEVCRLELLAGCAGIAFEQARLLAEIRESRDEVVRAQRQLIEAEKLAALGAMAASINHEINNPLTAIVLDLQLMGLTIGPQQENLRKRLQSMENSVNRIRAVVEKVAAVKRTIVTEYQPKTNMLDLNLSTK